MDQSELASSVSRHNLLSSTNIVTWVESNVIHQENKTAQIRFSSYSGIVAIMNLHYMPIFRMLRGFLKNYFRT